MWIVGGGKLAYALLPEIDRLILKQHSSVIGIGHSAVQRPVPAASVPPNRHSRAGHRRTQPDLRPALTLEPSPQ